MMPDAGTTPIADLIDLAAAGKLDLVQVILTAESLIASNQHLEAIALYRAWLKTPVLETAYGAWFNLGILLSDCGSQSEAEAAYRQAIFLKNDFPQAQYNLGVQLEKQGRAQAAIDQWKAALSLDSLQTPEHRNTRKLFLNGLGRLYDSLLQYEEAEETLKQSLALDPTQGDALYHWLHLRQKQCKWPIICTLPGISRDAMWDAASPLAILAMTDDPARSLKTSSAFVAKHVRQMPRMVPQGHDYGHANGSDSSKIRIGFLSGDFTLHAVSLLTVRLFELLDRDKYEVYGFGWSRNGDTPFRQRVLNAFNHFLEISTLNDDAAALLIQSHQIDVLVDLQGLTAGARPNIVAHGPAPQQIAFLGYPATSAIPYVDYVIADDFIFPAELAPHFTEQPLFLSDCFQVSDDTRTQAITDDPDKYGLPAEKFIFCAFNNNYKITPEIFESWMRILRRTPDSVLWLLRDNQWAEANMLSAAQAHGIEADRLIFAGRVAPENYLSRFGSAHLFLDTFPYNAGTTANDALWAGLPIVTLSGCSYVSRMAGSLLRSTGLVQLIAHNYDEYEDKAVAFANDKQLQIHCKERLQAAKATSTAFNTQKFVAEFSSMIDKLMQRDGNPILKKAVG
jgi:predicted O-linked N-acetylglucosamine transferase (SPINDLY family)